jgi:hypothetical protein
MTAILTARARNPSAATTEDRQFGHLEECGLLTVGEQMAVVAT